MSEKITKYAIFNKHNGALFAYEQNKELASKYNSNNFLVREITLQKGEYFFGDYYTGRVYSDDEKPLIREDEMEEQFLQDIISHYSLIKQIIILVGVLEKNKDIVKTDIYNQFATFLNGKKAKYEQSLKVVSQDKESFNFVSIKDLSDLAVKRMEGIV